MIKVADLIKKRAEKIYPRLAWLMLKNIYLMNGDINKKGEINAVMILISISEDIESNKRRNILRLMVYGGKQLTFAKKY